MHHHSQHNLVKIRAPGQDLLTAGRKLALRSHRQGEQIQKRIELGPAAELLKVQPHHLLLQEHLQRLGGAELEAAVGRDHQHRPVLHLWLLLQKPIGLCCQAVVEALVGVHLHLQQHHRKLGAAGFSAAGALAGPQNSIEAVAELFDLQCLKAVELITGSCRVEPQCVGKACF